MFHGSCRRVSKVLSMALEPIGKSTVHDLAKKVSMVKVAESLGIEDGTSNIPKPIHTKPQGQGGQ